MLRCTSDRVTIICIILQAKEWQPRCVLHRNSQHWGNHWETEGHR